MFSVIVSECWLVFLFAFLYFIFSFKDGLYFKKKGGGGRRKTPFQKNRREELHIQNGGQYARSSDFGILESLGMLAKNARFLGFIPGVSPRGYGLDPR